LEKPEKKERKKAKQCDIFIGASPGKGVLRNFVRKKRCTRRKGRYFGKGSKMQKSRGDLHQSKGLIKKKKRRGVKQCGRGGIVNNVPKGVH